MRIYFNFLFLLSISIILLKCGTNAKPGKETDKYYLVFVEKSETKLNDKIEKRQENDQLISTLVDEIHELILNNKNTYQNKSKYEALEKESELLKKRNEQEKNDDNTENHESSSFVYPILNRSDRIILVAYLSSYVKGKVLSMANVTSCIPDKKFKQAEYYNADEIFNETGWKSLYAIPDSSRHLSMISQGKYDSSLIGKYDTTYYYPGTAGKGINVIALDVGFNFNNYPEFYESEYQNRKVKCYGRVDKKEVVLIDDTEDPKKCSTKDVRSPDLIEGDNQDHGTMILDVVGGYYQGVAPDANLYGFVNSLRYSDVILALKHIVNSKYFEPKKNGYCFAILTNA